MNMLLARFRYVSWCSADVDGGMVPLSRLYDKSSSTSADSDAKDALIVPVKLLLFRYNALHMQVDRDTPGPKLLQVGLACPWAT